jgi:protein-tyrosine-phosphatase
MAEAIFNKISPNNMLALSAGLEPADSVDLRAMAVMKELDLKVNGKPRRVSENMLKDFDVIIEFDDLGLGERWEIKKPEAIEEYREVRREIWEKVEELVRKLLY